MNSFEQRYLHAHEHLTDAAMEREAIKLLREADAREYAWRRELNAWREVGEELERVLDGSDGVAPYLSEARKRDLFPDWFIPRLRELLHEARPGLMVLPERIQADYDRERETQMATPERASEHLGAAFVRAWDRQAAPAPSETAPDPLPAGWMKRSLAALNDPDQMLGAIEHDYPTLGARLRSYIAQPKAETAPDWQPTAVLAVHRAFDAFVQQDAPLPPGWNPMPMLTRLRDAIIHELELPVPAAIPASKET